MTDVHVLGIRHHGPGSAHSVAEALATLRPDVVLVEGPPELDQVIPLITDPDMLPPVAGLIYAVDEPRLASFYPMAAFSPEWVAIRWALSTGKPVRAIDLPAAHTFALRAAEERAAEEGAAQERTAQERTAQEPASAASEKEKPLVATSDDGGEYAAVDGKPSDDMENPPAAPQQAYRPDAIGMLAEAAGYSDAERWWEDSVEHRNTDPVERFEALIEAITEIRAMDQRPADHPDVLENNRREAAMRRFLRAAMREGHERIAVVCGAYHAPALVPSGFPSVSADNKVLAGLPKAKVAVTWVPWTSNRLSLASGYGAGVTAPGWYQHLFAHWMAKDPGQDVATTWLVRVAHALRKENLDASTASVVEASRMATALAAVRGRPTPGLPELDDAAQTVLCDGSPLPLALVHRELTVGRELGNVPDSVPTLPLAADLAATQRKLRMKPSAMEEVMVLDLRKPNQLARSVLLHRLELLGVAWGQLTDAGRTSGTFKEAWTLLWKPELAVSLVEASRYGTTVASAAAAFVSEQAQAAEGLPVLSSLLESCLLAELPDGIAGVVSALAERTALQQDVAPLLETIAPLARTCRYGNVRGVDVSDVGKILQATVIRSCVGLPTACAGLDDEAAGVMRRAIDSAQNGLSLLPELPLDDWHTALSSVANSDSIHGSVAGRATRLLLDAGLVEGDDVASRLSRRLSIATPATEAAAWLDGLLSGDATLLIHDRRLLQIVDEWVEGVHDDVFEDVLPLIRRTFSAFSRPERREIGEQLSRVGPTGYAADSSPIDLSDAGPALQTMARILGWKAIA
ncbi:DUF5682 family protein [Arthrobacter sp. StoSoilB22]|uniref:DUF5682 family protein n=1 Tax=Arthrobacter sp. StoSoilB22 TaxID=2830996 RepID=UPI001CC52307|nr:DUF5682 family protein [Arthrobacter sp. StoSoilB22]BCW63094.1 hypothetical protein StoSoilB22_20670 [Arthrobacter sp. StoSoilB22]